MFKKLKKDYKDFIKSKREIKELKKHIAHLEKINTLWKLTAYKSFRNFVAIKTKET